MATFSHVRHKRRERATILFMNVAIVSAYELGRQSFAVGSASRWLKDAGANVRSLDLAIQKLDRGTIRWADVVCFSVPMHTATRIAIRMAERVREINPNAHLCFFGLYASVNEPLFRSIGAGTVLGGEFEPGLVAMLERLQSADPDTPQHGAVLSLDRLHFRTPDRSGLPRLDQYAYITLADGSKRVTGYSETTRGCKHLCRHCPVVPVYGGAFRIVAADVVLADIEQQIAAGAEHITFGDPDFFNGPGHARKIISALHERWPELTYDVTIKVEHLVRQADLLPVLRDTGCVMVTTAVEAIDDRVLTILDKRHTREEFEFVVRATRDLGLALNPTFVTFTPWTSAEGYVELLETLATLELVENISPIQYGIRLLIPAGSRLLELPETQEVIERFDPISLVYPWNHPDPRMDRLHETVLAIVQDDQQAGTARSETWSRIWHAASRLTRPRGKRPVLRAGFGRPAIPHLSEPWYC